MAKSPHTCPKGSCGSRKGVFLLVDWPPLERHPSHCSTLLWSLLSCLVAASLVVPAPGKPPAGAIFLNIHTMLAVFLTIPAPGVRGFVRFSSNLWPWKHRWLKHSKHAQVLPEKKSAARASPFISTWSLVWADGSPFPLPTNCPGYAPASLESSFSIRHNHYEDLAMTWMLIYSITVSYIGKWRCFSATSCVQGGTVLCVAKAWWTEPQQHQGNCCKLLQVVLPMGQTLSWWKSASLH